MCWDLLSATGKSGWSCLLDLLNINSIILHCQVIWRRHDCGLNFTLFVLGNAWVIIISQFTRRLCIYTNFLVLRYLLTWFQFLNDRCRQVFLVKRIMLLSDIDAGMSIILLSLISLSCGFCSSRRDTLYSIILNQRIIGVYNEIFLMIDSGFL